MGAFAIATALKWSDPSWRVNGPGVILSVPLFYGFLFSVAYFRLRRRLRDPRNRFGRERTMAFDDEALVMRDEGGAELRIPWSDVLGRERIWRERVGRLPGFSP